MAAVACALEQPGCDRPFTGALATALQFTAALAALDCFGGTGTAAEHEAEAARLGGADAYRKRLANALLGAVQLHAMLAEPLAAGDADATAAAHAEQLSTCGMLDPDTGEVDPGKWAEFLRWQTLRVSGPLREAATDPASGPIVLGAAHAAYALQRMLGGIAAGQRLFAEPSIEAVAAQRDELRDELRAARTEPTDAIANIDVLEDLLAGAEGLFG
ncbi:DUF6245 family protein [Actinomadura gamaensis]|uniref:DUF6245 family protein n=1 Tax=Actinomadura gamaensis TaxID=1763541 RepID=A0ABV9UEU3_9ACTN